MKATEKLMLMAYGKVLCLSIGAFSLFALVLSGYMPLIFTDRIQLDRAILIIGYYLLLGWIYIELDSKIKKAIEEVEVA